MPSSASLPGQAAHLPAQGGPNSAHPGTRLSAAAAGDGRGGRTWVTKTADPKYSGVPHTPSSEWPSSKSLQIKHLERVWGKGHLPTLLLGCELVQPLWRGVRRVPGKLQADLFMVQQSHSGHISGGLIQKDTCNPTFTALRHGSSLSVHETQRFSYGVKRVRQRQTSYDITCTRDLACDTNTLIHNTETDSQTWRTSTLSKVKGGEGGH